ncbi:MAG: P2 family phage major capsid protein [[Pasteurella] mairii]|nr:P2 family phage major capsid protein [[Pasteurella] mairii]
MEILTINKLNQYKQNLSNAIKQDKTSDLVYYDLEPAQEAKLLNNLYKHSFFSLINIIKSTRQIGETLGINVPAPSQTNTETQERTCEKSYVTAPKKFNCKRIDIDSFITYAKLDTLAGYLDQDFDNLLDNYLDKQMLLSLLLVGFNGVYRAENSNFYENKLAEDVAKGWLQLIRDNAPDKVLSGVQVGEAQEYKTLNSLVKNALAKIDNPLRAGGDLVAICGRNIISDQPVKIEYENFSQDKIGLITISEKLIGGLKAFSVPYFPENSILITRLDNLSLYIHTGTIRRFLEKNPAKNRLENYISMNVDFVIEDYNAALLIDNINMIE